MSDFETPPRFEKPLKYRVVYYKKSPLPADFDAPLVPTIRKFVTPQEAQEIIDCTTGKCNFVLLPDGDLRLRVFDNSRQDYQFFPLHPDNFYAVLKED